MAEILVHRNGRGDPGDARDYQPGDVVTVQRDGFPWGRKEVGPNTSFFLVRLPGVKVRDLQHLEESDQIVSAIQKRRRYKITVNMQTGNEVTLEGAGRMNFLNSIGLKP